VLVPGGVSDILDNHPCYGSYGWFQFVTGRVTAPRIYLGLSFFAFGLGDWDQTRSYFVM
jgi:hypothetical protein